MTLYELTNSAIELYEMLQSEEIDEQTVFDTLESMEAEGKLEDCCKVVRQLESDTTSLKAEELRLQLKRKRAQNGISRIKSNLLNYMVATGREKQKAGLFDLSTRNAKSVHITDVSMLPEAVFEFSEPSISKDKIRKLIDSGQAVAGAEIIVNKSIQIK